MIYPCPVDFWDIRRFPLTWSIVFINIFIFFIFFLNARESSGWVSFFSDDNMTLTGRMYHHYVHQAGPEQRKRIPSWVLGLNPRDESHFHAMGSWALRDAKFLDSANDLEVFGDEVAIAQWKKSIYQYKNSYFGQLVFKVGLSHVNRNTLSWVTYQFSHSGLVHLLSNMSFLILFGAALEAMIGPAGLVIVYLCGGVVAGLFFLVMKTHGGAIPMVGASGSISAIMAFYILFEQRARVRFIYFVSFLPRHHGYIYLPTLWMLPMFILSDFSHHLGSLEGMGAGVAYSAHIGGTVFGLIAALACRYLFKLPNELLLSEFMEKGEAVVKNPTEF